MVSLIGLFINDGQLVFSIYEPLLRPWGALCRAITPDSWQTMGNILLGLAWMGSGILVYSALLGAIATLLLFLIEGRRVRSLTSTAAPSVSPPRVPSRTSSRGTRPGGTGSGVSIRGAS